MIFNRSPYDKAVIKAIRNYKDFSGTQVNDLKHLKSLFFTEDEYQKIIQSIRAKKLEELNDLNVHVKEFREYLDVMTFTDQNGATFIATIYDNDEMWQDPQVIDIFPY